MSGARPLLCSICFQPVELKDCEIDKDGRAVHKSCHAEMKLFAPKEPPKKRPAFWGTRRRIM